jgi:hypothetical protein
MITGWMRSLHFSVTFCSPLKLSWPANAGRPVDENDYINDMSIILEQPAHVTWVARIRGP